MITIKQLTEHLRLLDPQKNLGRLTFYQYLKNWLPEDALFTVEHLDIFYDRTLSFQYWRTNKNHLGELIQSDLKSISARQSTGIDIEQIVHSNEMQVVTIDYPRDFAALLAKDVEKMEKSGEKVKSFRLTNDKNTSLHEVLFVRLQKNGSLIVEVRQNIAVLVEAELQLLRPHTRLVYDQELEFDINTDQYIHTSNMRFARFRATYHEPAKINGCYIQAPHFHCTETFDRVLNEINELFHAIKRIERYYVNPITDPYFRQFFKNINQRPSEQQI